MAKQPKLRQVDYISFEARPLLSDIIKKAIKLFQQSRSRVKLIAALPPYWPGLHRCNFLEGKLRLHLIYGDANDTLTNSDFIADAWFLDGLHQPKTLSCGTVICC